MTEVNDKYRMFGLVPYNLSPIQQGIQYGHGVQEYNNAYDDSVREGYMSEEEVSAFKEWKNDCKTFIILNGGTTNNNPAKLGTINQHWQTLKDMEFHTVIFQEPDLGDQITAVVFLVDERVYNKKKFPVYIDEHGRWPVDAYTETKYYFDMFGDDDYKILAMREFLSQFRLA